MIEGVDLRHHGDVEARGVCWDFAVNVAVGEPPLFVAEALRESLGGVAAYPDEFPTRRVVAEHVGVDPGCVLLVNGVAEAFGLVARLRSWQRACVVHPQFTEPEAALVGAGHQVVRHVLDAEDGFVLRAGKVDEGADVVVVGNPTNPTSVLHPRGEVLSLLRPGRVVVVDEAFMDVAVGVGGVRGSESLLVDAARTQGLVVLRSLTKTFGLAGVRAGFVVAEPGLVEQLRQVQSPWSVNVPALAAMRAVCSRQGEEFAAGVAERVVRDREVLVQGLQQRGFDVVSGAAGPFVLVRHQRAVWVREVLFEQVDGLGLRSGSRVGL
ncbi:aminotransferase class I/II-fold pyridoxal phosphate-dependent enzyme [Dermatophilus congolensis]|uniref:aminotransferase class I/II-fold pyridoxal phosphate-dependent enzyme n=1 Tax=Dermatophilus congolensis TaxID=1863 RepID=UPI001AAED222|nr:aminotransferase class I/II-fold pyridoxal phosphate-dependent enzyme [Dermatophilus congolensis]MBO3201511.1 aminotransferase class I/II-fold pyridoxal phosphate-dependent enzyme [Dermatophilus congolensis]